jgi:hypothetical protein
MNLAVEKPQQALAWRIEFADKAVGGEAPLIRQPRSAWIRVQELNAPAVLREAAVPDSTSVGLTFVFLPSGAATPYDVQHQAEQWISGRRDEGGGMLEVQFRSERLLWRRGRAICFGSPQAKEEVFAAITRFSFCESELARLEQQVENCWTILEKHTELMESMSARSIKHKRDIDAMAKTATMMRLAYVRLQTALERQPGDLAGPTRRLFLELALQADTVDRLRMLGDSIEVIDEFYKHMREQFAEFSHFLSEYRVEVLIVIVLLAELLVFAMDKIW